MVHLQLLGKVLSAQSGREHKTILLVEEGYSEAEFLYKVWKVCTSFLTSLLTSYETISYAPNALPDLSGIFLSLVTVAPDEGSTSHTYRFEVDTVEMNAPSVQVAFVFYDKANLKEDRKSTRLNSSHSGESRMPSSA